MKEKLFSFGVTAVVLIVVAAWFTQIQTGNDPIRLVQPQRGLFRATVTTKGELRAKHAVPIYGPAQAQEVGIYQLTIQRLLPEGTHVEKGDVVAELDRSEVVSKIQDARHKVQQAESHYAQTQLDTSLTLSKVRYQFVDLRYAQEEALLRKKEAVYEPPATRRRAAIDFERAERAYHQAMNRYHIQVQQAQTQMRQARTGIRQHRRIYQDLQRLEQAFTIVAPDDGLLIYHRDWRGRALTTGHTLSTWNPVVATLPDLSVMESVTFVDEVDLLKVRIGQPVEISLDAAPGQTFPGTVTWVAPLGEQRPDSDAKGFEVVIEITASDPTLRPTMTTSNRIIVAEVREAVQVPVECIYTKDGLNYVFLKDGDRTYRQEVKLGPHNENEVIVEAGLTEEDRLYLSLPADTTGVAFRRLEKQEAITASPILDY